MTTIVTALYDINRETEGDGRAFKDYLAWLPETLSLDTNYVIYTEEKVIPYIPLKPNIKINVTTIDKIPLYSLIPKIKSTLDNSYYKKKIQDPNRVECKLPLYNVIQYSKFIWLKDAIQKNPFNSELVGRRSHYCATTRSPRNEEDEKALLPADTITRAL